MTSEVILRIRPGETTDDFTHRVVDTAPPLSPEDTDRLRALLPLDDRKTDHAPARTRGAIRKAA